MFIPVITGMQLSKSFLQGIYYSLDFAMVTVVVGLYLSYYLNLPAVGAIALLALGIYGLVAIFKRSL